MKNELGELYSELAQKIISMIPVNWDRIYYLGEVEKEQLSWSSVFYFEETDSKIFVKSHNIPEKYSVSQQIYDELLVELNSLLLKIYKCFEENDKPVWDQFDFSLTSDGKISVNFLYDKISENDGGQAKREIIWAYNSFGFKPKEGTFTRKLLDSYLNEK